MITFGAYVTNVVTVPDVVDTMEIWLTVKQSKNQLDLESILQVSKTGGLLYINGSVPVLPITSADASLSVTNSILTITLSGDLAALLIERSLLGEIKQKTTEGIITIHSQFEVVINNALTRAV